jgi:hypothetical protein
MQADNWNMWSVYWLTWIAIGFGIPEAIALLTGHPENTLSWQFWRLEGSGATIFHWIVGSLFAWLFLHMTFRIFRT